MEDVLLISSRHSEAAGVWVDYLTTCFNQVIHKKPPIKILPLCIEDLPPTISADLSRRIESARLIIPIICPNFLDSALQTPTIASAIRGLAFHQNPKKVVAMLLGVTEELITEHHKSILTSYEQWKRLSVRDQDQTFVHDFLSASMTVLGRPQENVNNCGKAMFTIFPKKVKPGHSRVIAVLNDPLDPEDIVTVDVDKSGEIIKVNHIKRRNPYTLQFNIPDSCLEVSMLVNVRIEKNGVPLGHRPVKCESRLRELDQILRSQEHPLEFMCQTLGFSSMDKDQLDGWMVMSFQRNLPPNFHLLAGAHPPASGPRQNIPEEYPTLLHFAARFGLERLSWQLLECPGGEIACETRNAHGHCPADIADHHGHQKLAGVLKGYMQMNELTSMYTYLKGMSDDNTKNKDVKRLPNTMNEPEYIRPRPISETYMVPPSARPYTPDIIGESSYLEMSPSNQECRSDEFSTKCSQVLEQANDLMNDSETDTDSSQRKVSVDEYIPSNVNQMEDYLVQPSNIKVNTKNRNMGQGDYLIQPSNICVNNYGDYLTHPSNKKVPLEKFNRQLSLNDNCPPVKTILDQKSKSHGALNNSKLSLKKSREQLNTEDELLEIINDFKNNVFTIAEVEQLVANWKNRNDVQQSFKDKQEQLAKMRQEYERIQLNMKESLKRPTPFDRVKKLFSRGKSKAVEIKLEVPSVVVHEESKPINNRPISSLSLHSVSSSSSSGRMSTGSVCSGASLGDSGTHSDNEDRKMLLNHIHGEAYGKRTRPGFDNYLVPPSPRPLNLNVFSSTTKLEERPPLPIPRPDEDNTYYIHFPPSGLPINSSKASPITSTSPNSTEYLSVCDYMNIHSPCGLRTIQEQETFSQNADGSNINSTSENSLDNNQTDNGNKPDNLREYMNVSYNK